MKALQYARFALACALIFAFVWSESPSLSSRLAHINVQMLYVGKSIAFIAAYVALFVALVLLALSSRKVFKWSAALLLGVSCLCVDVFYRASGGKVMEYIDFVILYQAKANALDALMQYASMIYASLPRTLALLLGFALMPSYFTPLSERVRVAGGGGV